MSRRNLQPSDLPSSVVTDRLLCPSGDCTPLIQAAIDAGQRNLVMGVGTWKPQTPLFYDSTAVDDPVTFIWTEGAVLQLQSTLPTAVTATGSAAFTADANMKFWIFNGTLRSAYNSGANTVTVVNGGANNTCSIPSNKGYLARFPHMRQIGMELDGNNLNAGVSIGNGCSISYEYGTGINWKILNTHVGYVDGNALLFMEFGAPSTATSAINGSWALYQQTNGDMVTIDHVKNYANGGTWNATSCTGGTVRDADGGAFVFNYCSGIEFLSGHFEETAPSILNPNVLINCSQVNFDSPTWFCGLSGEPYFIEINDSTTSSLNYSYVTLRSPRPVVFIKSAVTDPQRVADIYINAANPSTQLLVDGADGAIKAQGQTGDSPESIIVGSAVTGITTALNQTTYTTFQKAITAGRRWCLHQGSGANGGWIVDGGTPDAQAQTFGTQIGAPTLSTSSSPPYSGTLTNGTTYEYAVALLADDGAWATVSTAIDQVAGTAGAISLTMSALYDVPTAVVIWRGTAGNVLTAPSAYCVIPMGSVNPYFVDTGVNINGRAWATTSVPVPNTVAASNKTYARLIVPGSSVAVMAGSGDPNASSVPGAIGSLYMRSGGSIGTSLYTRVSTSLTAGWARTADLRATSQTASFTVGISDDFTRISTAGGAVVATLGSGSAPWPPNARLYRFVKTTSDANQVTFIAGTGSIEGTFPVLGYQYDAVTFLFDGTNWFNLEVSTPTRQVITSLASPPVSGTVYQNTTGRDLDCYLNWTPGTALSDIAISVSPDNVTFTQIVDPHSGVAGTQSLNFKLYAGWYYKAVASGTGVVMNTFKTIG